MQCSRSELQGTRDASVRGSTATVMGIPTISPLMLADSVSMLALLLTTFAV
jgi:hypothetical protein